MPIKQTAPEGFFTILEMSKLKDVSYRTLRFYEDKDLLSPRRVGMTRFYSERDCARLDIIIQGKKLGFSLSEITRLIGDAEQSSCGVISSLTEDELLRRISRLTAQRKNIQTAIEEFKRALALRKKANRSRA